MRWSSFYITVASVLPYALVPTYGFAQSSHLDARQTNQSTSVLQVYPGQAPLPSLEEIARLNATNGTFLPLDEIQADVMVGMRKAKQLFYFYTINNPRKFKQVLAKNIHPLVTSTSELICTNCTQPPALLNVAWSAKGLRKLSVFDNLQDDYFHKGQVPDAVALGDPGLTNWVPGFARSTTDGVFLIASKDWEPIDSLMSQIQSWLGPAITVTHSLKGNVRPGIWQGHEHFGFLDGFSQPAVAGFATSVFPGQALIFPGTILTGEIGDPRKDTRPAWTKWGSFLAFRQLKEFVPEFDKYLVDFAPSVPGLTPQQNADLLGARMFGRWKSGTPLDMAPLVDDPSIGADPHRNNDFDFNHPPPFDLSSNQTWCPFSAHIRKIRPRADENNANMANHMVRSSIPYGPELTDAEAQSNKTRFERGIAFVAYQSDIDQGFRFQQAKWANNINDPIGKSDPTPGFDPIIGANNGRARFASGLDPTDPDRDYYFNSTNFVDFVQSRGGEYFFSPSISAILKTVAA